MLHYLLPLAVAALLLVIVAVRVVRINYGDIFES